MVTVTQEKVMSYGHERNKTSLWGFQPDLTQCTRTCTPVIQRKPNKTESTTTAEADDHSIQIPVREQPSTDQNNPWKVVPILIFITYYFIIYCHIIMDFKM